MRSNWIRRAGLALLAVGVMGCGALSGVTGGVVGGGEPEDFVGPAKKVMDDLKAEITLLIGMRKVLEQKVDEFLYFDDALKLGKVKWADFRKQLTNCWDAPFEAADGVEKKVVNTIEAAQHYQGQTALHEVKVVRDTAWNAVNTVKKCPSALADEVQGFPKKAQDEALMWARGKLDIINEVRVLAKKDIPDRALKVVDVAKGAPQTLGEVYGKAVAKQAALEKLGNMGKDALAKHNVQMGELDQIKNDLTTMAGKVSTDAQDTGKAIADMATKVTQGVADFGGKK